MLNSYWKTVLSVFTGSAIAQVIPVLGALLIARQFGPGQFGLFSAWLGIVIILSTALTGRLEVSLALERDGRFRNAAAFAVLATTLLAAILVVLVLGLVHVLTGYNYFDSLMLLLVLVPCATLFALNQAWQSWAAAEGRFRQLNMMRVAQSIFVVVLQIAAGFIWPTATALAVSYVLGLLLAQAYGMWLLPVSMAWIRRWRPLMQAYARRHRKFLAYSLPADFINALAIQLPVMIVAYRFGAESAGYLALVIRVLGLPLSFLGKAVLDVFKRQASMAFRERGECRYEYVRTFWVLGAGSVIFAIGAYFLSEPVFAIAFGEEWRPAGLMSVLLVPMFTLRFIASPLSYVIYIFNKQQVDLIWQICLLAMTYGVLSYVGTESAAILIYSVSYALLYVVYLAISYRYSCGESHKQRASL